MVTSLHVPEKRATGGGTRHTKKRAVGRWALQGMGRGGQESGTKGEQGMIRERERDQEMRR